MSMMARLPLPTWLAAATIAVLAVSPSVAADTGPDVVNGPADEVIADLKDQGYAVEINWLNGFDPKPLSECYVTGINNPGDEQPSKTTFVRVYLDVVCPNHDD